MAAALDEDRQKYVRIPFADQGLNKIPNRVTDRQALLAGDVLATGFWAAKISEIKEEDTVLIIGAGPTGICTLLCVMLKKPKRIIVCEKDKIEYVLLRSIIQMYGQLHQMFAKNLSASTVSMGELMW